MRADRIERVISCFFEVEAWPVAVDDEEVGPPLERE